MTKVMTGRSLDSVPGSSRSTAGRPPVRLGSYTYLPASTGMDTTKGVLMKGGLPVTLEVTEDILQQFMDSITFLEESLSRGWVSSGVAFGGSAAE
ncbi:hypothetical protein [Streptomyces sp. Caat 7-52]|uniref:hypothetical protein n=1 Tax=Streptomyces sp. Caat 7-52 TaxID=2949637 RepID=UPI002034DE1B|nr:hypothetical protein [Streptomyces sp. Caat 7-52]